MPYPPSVVSLSGHDREYCPYGELISEERAAVDIIKSILREHNLPDEPLYFRYTDKYLTVAADKFNPFARLKLTKDSWYVAFSCGDPVTRKKFLRIDIADVSEIAEHAEEIVSAYRFASPVFSESKPADLEIGSASSDLSEFFRNIVLHDGSTSFKPSDEELEFFGHYIEGLKASGLNWRAVPVDLMSDGAIKVRGGRIKLRKRGSYMTYTKSKDDLATKVKNLSLAEYIELLKYWVADCVLYKDIYSL